MYTKVIRATGLAVHLVGAAQLSAYRALYRRGGQNVEDVGAFKFRGTVVVALLENAARFPRLINIDDDALEARLLISWAENDGRTLSQLEHVKMKREARGRLDDDDVRKQPLLGPLSNSGF